MMKMIFYRFLALSTILFLFSGCVILNVFAPLDGEICERYSIYKTVIFGDDTLLWEGTACEDERSKLKDRYDEKFANYEAIYGSTSIYFKHVSYTKYQ